MDLNLDRICTIRKNLRDLYTTMSLILFVLLCGTLVGIDASDHKCTLKMINHNRSLAYVCIEADISNLEEIPSTVDWIEFSVSRLPSIPADTFSRFFRLQKLTFSHCNIRNIDPAAFRGLNNLQLLVLYNSKIGVVRASSFQHLPNLRRLDLEKNELVHVMPEAFSGLTNVMSLSLYNNDLNCLPIDLLSDLPRLKNIQIGRNPWLCSCKKDLELFFERRGIHSGHEGHSFSSRNECMTEVKLAEKEETLFPVNKAEPGTILTSSEVVGISLSVLTGLEEDIRWISANGINIKRIPAYTFFRFGNSLRSLEFQNCSITEVEADAFAGLAKLKRLVLVGNYLNVIKANWFYDLVNLQTLILDTNQIVTIESRTFSPLGKLRHLSLNSNKLECLSIDELRKLVQLQRLNVNSNTWNCSCQVVLKNYLVSSGIGYTINDFHCDSLPLESNEIKESGKITKRHQIYEIHKETMKNTTTVVKLGSVTKTTTGVQTVQEIPVLDFDDEVLIGKNCCTSCRKVDIPDFEFAYSCYKTTLDQANNIPSRIDALIFTASHITTITRRSLRRFGQSLKMLKLWNCQTKIIERDAFADLVALETLVIYNGNLEIVRASWFDALRNVRHLVLTGNKITRIEDGVFPHLPNLMTLEIDNNRLTCISLDLLDSLRDLRFMRIAGNPWTCSCRLGLVHYLEERRISYERDMFQNDIHADESQCLSTTTAATPIVATRPPSSGCNQTVNPASSHCVPVSTKGQCIYEKSIEQGQINKYRCTNGNLSVLDQISSNTESIELDGVRIHYLPPRTFSKFQNLTKLVIRNCGLHKVDSRAFEGLFKLQELTIQNNLLVIVDSSWFRDTRQDLHNLKKLSLTGNKITRIEDGVFAHLPNLVTLEIDNNRMTCISLDLLDSLRELRFMRIAGNPWTCSCRLRLVHYLEKRRISYERDMFQNDIHADESQCLSTTTAATPTVATRPPSSGCNQTADPASSHCVTVSTKGQCIYERSVEQGQIIKYRCTYGNLSVLDQISSHAESIELDGVCIHYLPPRTFSKFQNLTKLVIRNCGLHEVDSRAFEGLFKLQELTIHNNLLVIVDSSWFRDTRQDLHNLKKLSLTGNKITRIEDGVFSHLPNLVTLEIDNNRMTCISLDLLDSLRELRFMRIAGNPWTCSCRLRLVKFLEAHDISYERDIFQNDIHADESQCLFTTTAATPTVTTKPSSFGCNKAADPASNHCVTVSTEGQCTYDKGLEVSQIIKYNCTYGNLSVLDQISSNAESIELDEVCIHYLPPRAFSKFQNLTKLVIRNCGLHEVDPRAFDGLFKLQELTIHNNRLVTINSSWFRDTTQLRNLSLTKNYLVEIAVDTFANLMGSLEHLSLQGNNLTCIYTKMLENLKHLKSMEFGENKLKWRCWAELSDYLQLRHVIYTKMSNPRNSKELVLELFQQKPELETSSADVTSVLKFLVIELIFLVQCF